MKCILQAGHLNIKTNCNTLLRGSTGAGGEVEINTAVRDLLATYLKNKGIEVKTVDANFNCDPTSSDSDWDLFLTLHCDMDYANDTGSGFCDFPEPSTDLATAESQRIAKVIQDSFFKELDINVKSRSNANTRYYYMWKFLSSMTPCVLIEMGQVKDAHDSGILKDTPRVAQALCNSILLAFGMLDTDADKIAELEKELNDMRESRDKWKTECGVLTKKIGVLDLQIESMQTSNAELTAQLTLSNKTNADMISTLNTRIDTLTSDNKFLHDDNDALQASLEIMTTSKNNFETKYNDLKTKLDQGLGGYTKWMRLWSLFKVK